MPKAQKIAVAVALVIAGAVVTAFPIFSKFVGTLVGIVGILYSVVLWTLYRTSFRTRKTMALAIVAVIVSAAGILLLINRWLGWVDARYLVLAVLAALGAVTVGLGVVLRSSSISAWMAVLIAGIGTIVAGLCALWRVEAAFGIGCLTAAVILLRPLVLQAVRTPREKKDKKIVTIREKDIEVIPADEDGRTEKDNRE